ncbi:DNA-binding transcriptional LysR family regulator [Pararhizobium capsulatum DSM 1112]|uniref:DNA-binding transcriptional LysR family regulator n=1 Tax=Pararhizobium capsulatum DSM 1112 TaxID=1121113 RepID=A0ABU0BX28_9HYPH|nr:transcriptional regulator GcvA [Pararhizobium capsulatum]MDQ0322816.1 DNA-binding transcriptional LysR family regulator [Pararhizobium capsulatum DSM 1112]
MRGRLLPSLNSIRTFEAVARHNSFTRAAEELNVTQSAASRLVRSLEEYLQVALFTRQSRRIELTDQGRFYNELLRDALDLIEAGTVELISSKEGKGTLSIGMLPTFGTRWLLPRLPTFQEQHPEIALNIVSSDGELDFTKERIDVAIRFGHGNWPDAIIDPLMSEEIQVVCSPKLMTGKHPITTYESLRFHRLIRHSTRPNSWEHWFRSVGVHREDLQWGPSLEHFFMIIQAAIAGLGVALLPTFLIEEDLRNGNLIAPFSDRISGPGAYYLVTSAAKSELPRVKIFRSWLLGQLE